MEEEEEEEEEEGEVTVVEGREGRDSKFCMRNCWTDWLAKEDKREFG